MKKASTVGKNMLKGNPSLRERCANPWNGQCNNVDIALYIYYRGEKLPICWPCWNEIAEKDIEWGEGIA